jgi:hypothetical protein
MGTTFYPKIAKAKHNKTDQEILPHHGNNPTFNQLFLFSFYTVVKFGI